MSGLLFLSLLMPLAAGCGRSAGDLAAQLESDDLTVRLRAIDGLYEKQPDIAISALSKALRDNNLYVRRNSARTLATYGSHAINAVPDLLLLLKDKEPTVRKAALNALKVIDPDLVPKTRP